MFSSRGGTAYGQQSYSGQYGQNLSVAYTGSSVGGPDGASQLSLGSQRSSVHAGLQEADVNGYRGHPSATSHFEYDSMYGSTSLGGSQQLASIGGKRAGVSAVESRGSYTSAIADPPKISYGDYISTSSHIYRHKSFSEKVPDYSTIERRPYVERHGTYIERDLQTEPSRRFTDHVGFGHMHQSDAYDPMDQTPLLRQEQFLKVQPIQSTSLDRSRQAKYLVSRDTVGRHTPHDLLQYGGRVDTDPRSLPLLSSSSYGGQEAPSILGAAPRRKVDEILYGQSSSNPGYGVSLPPGRDYSMGKGLHGGLVESDYSSGLLPRGSLPRIEEHKDDRASYLREFELREDERRRERLRERERDKDRERERLRQRERERELEKERVRELLERREKERERDNKRSIEIKRERSPPRFSKERRGSSLTKEVRSSRWSSPRGESLHRRRSPLKEIRRDYTCKVYQSNLVIVEKDYLSICKRYPKLSASTDFTKAVVYWPKENLKLSMHTAVSFEHAFLEHGDANEQKDPPSVLLAKQPEKQNTVWNAKVMLMSGLSRSALEDISSDKSFGDWVPHVCNILRFAVLKKEHSLMSIGGSWDPIDGEDPSVDASSLVKTAIRYAKDVTQLDLQNCQNWNPFLEIHYERIGKDGHFIQKEVTVIFVPNLSDCLPSLDSWREKWLAHKKSLAERGHKSSPKKERSEDKVEVAKEKDVTSSKGEMTVVKSVNKNESVSSEHAGNVKSDDNTGSKSEDMGDGKNEEKPETSEVCQDDEEKDGNNNGGTPVALQAGAKPTKKIIRKVVKLKDANKASDIENSDGKQIEKPNNKNAGENEIPDASSGGKTFVQKKVVKKASTSDNPQKGKQSEEKSEMEPKVTEIEANEKADSGVKQESGMKTVVKKKVIKKVVTKKKTVGEEASVEDSEKVSEADKQQRRVDPKSISETCSSEKQDTPTVPSAETETQGDKGNTGVEAVDVKNASRGADTEGEKGKMDAKESHYGKKLEGSVKSKDGKEKRKAKLDGEMKEKDEEPPRPGFILQTKGKKDSKMRSTSLSLDSLLDYSDKDMEESRFEISLFAESLYEMLQYQMGCRLLSFLQKLHFKFVVKKNQHKRRRDETNVSANDLKISTKHLKTSKDPVIAIKPVSSEKSNPEEPNDEKMSDRDGAPHLEQTEDTLPVQHAEDTNMDNKEDDGDEQVLDEDPEEDPEWYEESEDEAPQVDHSNEETGQEEKTDVAAKPEIIVGVKEGREAGEPEEDKPKVTSAAETKSSSVEDIAQKKEKVEAKTNKEAAVDKELLQAFRFFDRNRVGYIRVEDLRVILHSLGKFLSHRDVKDLAQSALLESGAGRDDRIMYDKLKYIIYSQL
ncbi:hypothetical protein SAY87_024980 [Trapa incisa]|uniref:EF-hand domain-containing protein n=1 Tax=Trapa incisa TaxID=236973 RepID=A0AAN7GLQ5_9MYRT|nr:hypothetical protein SAY87_024980 [Trapa incisa]